MTITDELVDLLKWWGETLERPRMFLPLVLVMGGHRCTYPSVQFDLFNRLHELLNAG